MPIHNSEIAHEFNTLADLLEIQGANAFRIRAYRNAARVIQGLSRSAAEMVEADEDLTELSGIGKDLADKIATLVNTGKLPLLDEVEEEVPEELSDLMHVEGLGPKRVQALYKELGVRSLRQLREAVEQDRVAGLSGFGQKTQQKIRRAVERLDAGESGGREVRTPWVEAREFADSLVSHLGETEGLGHITVAGSFRRCKETVGDLDILVTTDHPGTVMDRFTGYDEVDEVVSKGSTRSTVRLRNGLQVDLRVLSEQSYGAALHYFTGSKAHNIRIRKRGVERDLKVNEYGIFRGDKWVAGRTEEEVFSSVGLPYIEPELREDRGEIEAAERGELPKLVTLEDIRGDLHCHTDATDGRNSLEEMAEAARDRGYEYLAVTDHTKRVSMAHGLDEKRLAKAIDAVDRLNDSLEGLTVLKAAEVDILKDGSLDLPDRILKRLDLTVCSVHYDTGLSRKRQTERIIKAMDHPHFKILGHPSGRLINEREAYKVDLEAVMRAAAERGCVLEVNGQPSRLDLTDSDCILAGELGVRLALSSDAHATGHLAYMELAVGQARRGWVECDQVINTRKLKSLRNILNRN